MDSLKKLTTLMNFAVNPYQDIIQAMTRRLLDNGITVKIQVGYNTPTLESVFETDGSRKEILRVGIHQIASVFDLLECSIGVENELSEIDKLYPHREPFVVNRPGFLYEVKLSNGVTEETFLPSSLEELKKVSIVKGIWCEALTKSQISYTIRSLDTVADWEERFKLMKFRDPEVQARELQKKIIKEIEDESEIHGKNYRKSLGELLNLKTTFEVDYKNIMELSDICHLIRNRRFQSGKRELKKDWERHKENLSLELKETDKLLNFYSDYRSYYNCAYLNHVCADPGFRLLYPKVY